MAKIIPEYSVDESEIPNMTKPTKRNWTAETNCAIARMVTPKGRLRDMVHRDDGSNAIRLALESTLFRCVFRKLD